MPLKPPEKTLYYPPTEDGMGSHPLPFNNPKLQQNGGL